jgi:outer membrane protein assembly factor BamB
MSQSIDTTVPQDLAEDWVFTGRSVQEGNAPLLVAGDRLIGFKDNTLYAVDLYQGREVVAPNDAGFPYSLVRSDPFATEAPAIASSHGAIFFPAADADGNGILQALRLIDGLPVAAWQAPKFDSVRSLATAGDVVVVVAQDASGNTIASAVRATDGTAKWGPLTLTQLSSGAVGCGDGAIFFASGQHLFAVNTGSGDTRFPKPAATAAAKFNINQAVAPLVAIPPAPSADPGVVICMGDQVRGFDIRSGALRWSYAIAGDRFAGAAPAALSGDGTMLAVLSDGKVLSLLDTGSGTAKWQGKASYAGTPLIAGDTVFICGSGQKIVASFDLATGNSRMVYALGNDISAVPPAIGNGHIFLQDAKGAIHAKPYADQSAAYFDGRTGFVEIAADGHQFDFGAGDFTIEAWVRTCEGGEILCGYPTDAAGTGFRLNLSERGELRFAISDLAEANRDLGKSRATRATDGQWHHIAVVRTAGDVSFFVDAVASSPATRAIRAGKAVHANGSALDSRGRRRRDLLTQPPPPAAAEISGENKLYIGWDRYGEMAKAPTPVHFTGLIREVRLWSKALDAATIKSRKDKVLGPKGAPAGADTTKKANEPQLLGNWHLDESYDTDRPVPLENDVAGHEFAANFHSPRALISDLELDLSAFPYLLDRMDLAWPYAAAWTARGEHDLSTPPALSDNGYVCFGAGDNLYGVRRLDGARQWGCVLEGHSAPVAAGTSFYVQTTERGVMVVDAATGASAEVAAFQGLPMATDRKGHVSAPAASGAYLAAAAQSGEIWVANPAVAAASGHMSFQTGTSPGDLQFEGSLVCCVAGAAAARRLYVYDTAKQQVVLNEAVDADVFTVCGSRVFFTQNGALVAIDTAKPSTDQVYRATTNSPAAAQISGLAADSDGNILAVSTSTGQLQGLSMATLAARWTATVPDGKAAGGQGKLHAPTIADRVVYCTSQSGTVAAFDMSSGRSLGLFFEPTAVITPARVQAGTAYFGCAPAAPESPLDGALHSVVFGDMAALRLGVDVLGKQAASGYASIPRNEPLFVGDDGECCVEAWVNANMAIDAKGGEIVSIQPAARSNIGLRLFLDADGKVHFIGHNPNANGGWDAIHVQTAHPTSLRDGQWHHVAASRAGARDVRLYVDGTQQEIDAPAFDHLATADLAGDRFEIRIGAPAYQAAPDDDTCFHGLIGEVRLWETYLPADQISARMHTKLRGDEFSLVAFWDFDTQGVHDMARNGYDGALVPADDVARATFWLCDLAFAQPDYPDVATSAKVIQIGEDTTISGSNDNQYADTIYELTITCTKADRSPLADAQLRLWHVAHSGEQQAQAATLSTGGTNPAGKPPVVTPQTLTPIAADQEGTTANPGFIAYTDPRGRAVIRIAVAAGSPGPSFDLSADFMPANERFHVNVLIDSQLLAKAPPPSLMVQTKLIQDYAYSPGDKIDDTRSRNTYRAIITAQNADHSPRPYEWLEISALDYTSIEVGDKSYDVNPHNAQTFQADAKGQLDIVVEATDLKTADLSVWAGFMHQGERVTIALDQDAHQSMSQVKGDAMKDDQRMTNWRPDSAGGPQKGSLLKDDYKDHADDVAKAIQHVSSATQPSPAVAPAVGDAGTASNRFRDMRQPVRPRYGDRGQALRTLRHVQRRIPVTPESVLASIRQASGGDHVGFYLSFGGGGAKALEFGHFTAAEADHHMGRTRPATTPNSAGTPVGWFGSDLCDECESLADQAADAAKAAAEAAQKLAVEIGDKVTVAIQYVDDVVNVVVNSIADAMEIVATFLEKIALLVVEFIEFLLFLFDWKAIIETHRILKHSMFNAFDYLLDGGKLGANMARIVGEAFEHIPGLSSLAGAATNAAAQIHPLDRVSQAPSNDHGDSNGIAGSKILSKIVDFCTGGGAGGGGALPTIPPEIEKFASDASNIVAILPELVSASPSDVGDKMLGVLKALGGDLKALITDGLKDAVNAVVPNIGAEDLDVSFDIPFISALYEWITGDELTLVDATCLMLAIPVNIGYAVMSGGGHFNDDADGLADKITGLRRMSEPYAMAVGGGDLPERAYEYVDQTISWSAEVEMTIVAARTFQLIFAGINDLTFKYPGKQSKYRDYGLVVGALLGGLAGVLQSHSFQPDMYNWLIREDFTVDAKLVEDIGWLNLSVSVFPLVIAAVSGTAGKILEKISAGDALESAQDKRDMAECLALLLNSFAAAAAVVANLTVAIKISESCSSRDPLEALWLNFACQAAQTVTSMDAFVYTQLGGLLVCSSEGTAAETYAGIAALNCVARIAAGAAQGAGAGVLGGN